MPIKTTCPNCRTVYTLADHLDGKTVRCKECAAAIVVRAGKKRAEEDVDEIDTGTRKGIQTRPQAGSSAARGNQKRARDDDEERPRRRNREEDSDSLRTVRRSNRGLVIGLVAIGAGLVLLLGGGILAVVLLISNRSVNSSTDLPVEAGEPPNGDAVTRALFRLKSTNPHNRMDAARQLKDMLPDERRGEVIKALEPLIDDEDFFTRQFAIEALGVWGNKDAVPILLKAMKIKETRGEAMKALGRLKDERAVEPIAERLEDFFDNHHAAEALKLMGPMAEKAVLARLNHHDWHTRIAVCDILGTIGTKQSIPALEKAAAKDFSISIQAREAVKSIQARQS